MPLNLKSIFASGAEKVIKSVGDAFEKNFTTKEERSEAWIKLTEELNRHFELIQERATSVIISETQGNWLQRSWRPLIMLAFGFIIIYRYFISPVFNSPAIEMPERLWDLLELGIGGYVIGRSAEKIANTVVKNVDISFMRKKDRNAKK